jgi:hypothetical protein
MAGRSMRKRLVHRILPHNHLAAQAVCRADAAPDLSFPLKSGRELSFTAVGLKCSVLHDTLAGFPTRLRPSKFSEKECQGGSCRNFTLRNESPAYLPGPQCKGPGTFKKLLGSKAE